MKIFNTFIFILLITLVSTSEFYDDMAIIKPELEIEITENDRNNETYESILSDKIKEELKEIQAINNDAIAYLYIEGIASDPVMMSSSSNDKYLKMGRDGSYKVQGELFFSKESKVFGSSDNLDMTKIYGHNMKSGVRFGNLSLLLNEENIRPLYYWNGNELIEYQLTRALDYEDGSKNFEGVIEAGLDKYEYLKKNTNNYIIDLNQLEDVNNSVLILQNCSDLGGIMRHMFIFTEVARYE